MRRTSAQRSLLPGLLFVLRLGGLAALLAAGCKQGEGERCEVDNDCGSGLMCDNPFLNGGLCVAPGTPTVRQDAAVDARVVDAPAVSTPDAPADLPVEATPRDTAPDLAPDGAPDGDSASASDAPAGG